jgi:hypothetical protein
MSPLKSVKIQISPMIAKKLLSNKQRAQIPHQLLTCSHKEHPTIDLDVIKPVHTRIQRAIRGGKAIRLSMDEMATVDGAGKFKDFLKKVAKGVQKGYKHIKPLVAPLVKKGVNTAFDFVEGQLAPILPEKAEKFLREKQEAIVDKIGQVTGAYGMLPMYVQQYPMTPSGAGIAGMGMTPVVYQAPPSTWGTFLYPQSQAMNPVVPYQGFGLPADLSGGSFRAI